jgi:uncharacterized membrane protein YdbT with pleckstrin-like domain
MLPVGSTNDTDPKSQLALRPVVTKTFLKGAIGIGVFSIFLNINQNFVNYLIFLALMFGVLSVIVYAKRASKFSLSDDRITIKKFLHRETFVLYTDIIDVTVSQGILAKRFDCGTVFMILKQGAGSVKIMGGGVAERLDDVQNPNYIRDLISNRMSPFFGG